MKLESGNLPPPLRARAEDGRGPAEEGAGGQFAGLLGDLRESDTPLSTVGADPATTEPVAAPVAAELAGPLSLAVVPDENKTLSLPTELTTRALRSAPAERQLGAVNSAVQVPRPVDAAATLAGEVAVDVSVDAAPRLPIGTPEPGLPLVAETAAAVARIAPELKAEVADLAMAPLAAIDDGGALEARSGSKPVPMTPVPLAELGAQAQALIRQLGPERSEARLQLHPAELGQLNLELRQDGSRLEISVTVDNEQTRRLVQEQLGQWREGLAASGMQLDKLDVGVQQQAPRQQTDAAAAEASELAAEDVKNPSKPLRIRVDGALDYYV